LIEKINFCRFSRWINTGNIGFYWHGFYPKNRNFISDLYCQRLWDFDKLIEIFCEIILKLYRVFYYIQHREYIYLCAFVSLLSWMWRIIRLHDRVSLTRFVRPRWLSHGMLHARPALIVYQTSLAPTL